MFGFYNGGMTQGSDDVPEPRSIGDARREHRPIQAEAAGCHDPSEPHAYKPEVSERGEGERQVQVTRRSGPDGRFETQRDRGRLSHKAGAQKGGSHAVCGGSGSIILKALDSEPGVARCRRDPNLHQPVLDNPPHATAHATTLDDASWGRT
jgi:hypothetical protein